MGFSMNGSWPSLTALRAFWLAARHLSMQQAASDLHVTPTAISHQIRVLEEDLHVRLFERRTRALRLTVIGESLYRVVSGAFGDLNAGIEAIRASAGNRPVTVAASPLFASKWLLPRLHEFETRHPGIEVRVLTTPFVNLNDIDCDVAFRYGTTGDGYKAFRAEPIFDVKMQPVCSPHFLSKVTKRGALDLYDAALLHDEDAGKGDWVPGWGDFCETVLKIAAPRTVGMRFSSAYMVMESAIASHGLALVISEFAASDVRAGRLVCPLDLSMSAAGCYWLFTRISGQFDTNVRAFASWILGRSVDDSRRRAQLISAAAPVTSA